MPNSPINSIGSGSATVTEINLEGFEAARLKAMGIYEGQTVQLAQHGNPVIVKAAGGKMALADEIANRILVSVDEV